LYCHVYDIFYIVITYNNIVVRILDNYKINLISDQYNYWGITVYLQHIINYQYLCSYYFYSLLVYALEVIFYALRINYVFFFEKYFISLYYKLYIVLGVE